MAMEEKKQWETPEQQALRRRIEEHPLLRLPAGERLSHTGERMDLVMMVMRLKKFEDKLQRRLQSADSAMLQDEEELRAARTLRRESLPRKFDGETFTICIYKAIAGFDPARGGSFLAYFDRIYGNAMHASVNREDAIYHQERQSLSRREIRMLKEMQQLARSMGYDLKALPPRCARDLARSMGITEEALRDLLAKTSAAQRFVSMDVLPEEEEGSGRQYADPHSQDTQARLESLAEVLRAVQMFADLDCQEYPRLFFTNDVLRPMKDSDPAVDPETYCRVLLRMQDQLWNRIFVQGYIRFAFLPPPEPDSLPHLLEARLGHPLQDASIAAYKQVSAAAVSYQRKRYNAARQAWFRDQGFDG